MKSGISPTEKTEIIKKSGKTLGRFEIKKLSKR